MKLTHLVRGLAVAALIGVAPSIGFGQEKDKSPKPATKSKPPSAKLSSAQKIALAESAGPAEISKNATIMDVSDMSHPEQLRAGTNGWVCYALPGEPMCLDKQWQSWMEGYMHKSEPKVDGTGLGYMLIGDKGASNTDPYATGPTADNQWVVTPAHVMLLFQNPNMLDAYPTDPKSGGPWVMWKGTPYAHVMVPVSPTKGATMPK